MKFLSKYVSLINLRDLVTSLTASVIILAMIACGGAAGVIPVTVPGVTKASVHLATSQRAGSHIFPGNSGKPFLAGLFNLAMFASAPAASTLQQSYDAVCNFQPGFLDSVPSGSLVPLALAGESNSCAFFSGPQPNSGKQTFFDGTLSSLVVTGRTVSGATFECRDITNTAAVLDNSFVRAYLDPNANSVVVVSSLNGSVTQVPFTCTGIGTATDKPATIEAMWAKQ